jgi:hypothetical protein
MSSQGSSYQDLGRYSFVTGTDTTGLNPGNISSVLNTSNIRVPYFEMYRLLLNTSSLPNTAQVPNVVQTATASGTSPTTLNITFAKATTIGNTIVVVTGSSSKGGAGTNPRVSAVTLGASADHFGVVSTTGAGSTGFQSADQWCDPSCTVASTAIVVTLAGGSATTYIVQGIAYELSGMFATTTATAAVDDTTNVENDFSNATSGSGFVSVSGGITNANTTTANDLIIGSISGYANSPGSAFSNSTAGWNNITLGPTVNSGASQTTLSCWQLAASAGGSPSATVNFQPNIINGSIVGAAFLPSTTVVSSVPFPFTVAVDGHVWDQQQTAAGVGYTYNLNQPLYLNNGSIIQILWQLPASQYATYTNNFNISGWFRYDPDAQPDSGSGSFSGGGAESAGPPLNFLNRLFNEFPGGQLP